MSITAIYVFTTTAFTVDVPSMIEQLARTGPDAYSVVARKFEARKPFTLEPGVYRLTSTARITPARGFAAAELSAPGGTSLSPGHIVSMSGTKGNWPDPPATTASATLNIPLATMRPFLTDAGAETVLGAAPSANG